ncbi:Hypothetical_protein [Hexamita inflata]|uniref:Hypothetical_protein n=1 Tax=Hexamita inflata TaxID=28002 RepID=A0ABP1IKI5_9EUKA
MLCANQYFDALSTTIFQTFGIIGYINGILLINSISTELYILQGTYSNVGIFGIISGLQINALNINIQIQTFINQTGLNLGAFSGQLLALQQTISNITISNSRIAASASVGLVAAFISSKTTVVNNVYISSSQLFCQSIAESSLSGSVIADIYGQAQIYTCIIQNVSLYSYAENLWAISGGVIGDSHIYPIIMQQIIVRQSLIQAEGSLTQTVASSGLLAFLYSASVQIQNATVKNINVSGFSNATLVACSGIISQISNTTVSISNTILNSLNIIVKGIYEQTGIILGSSGASSFIVNNVSTEGINMINQLVIQNCVIVVNQSQSGC